MVNDFNRDVERLVQRVTTQTYQAIEADVAAKRIAWFDRVHAERQGGTPVTPRQAYELLLLEYLGLSEDEVPVMLETDRKIVWRSYNPCPTLEACIRLGLDTREVCRAVYERSTQALLSRLDPQLRFVRSYDEIRPHADYCEEAIVWVDFDQMMRCAVAEARQSISEGNKGYGAVVVRGDHVLAEGHDTAITDGDPSLHAEFNAIRRAVRTSRDDSLYGAVLFSTCEPCPMCSSLAVWANVTSIVYGASIEETARAGRKRIRIGANEVADRSPGVIEVVGGVLPDECCSLYI
ncbi:MAG: nucleoside deaminase [Phycisphaerales bacterium]|nr:MAG: nucleoside deaminase [Phycisphaerales bacterium]